MGLRRTRIVNRCRDRLWVNKDTGFFEPVEILESICSSY